MPAKKKMPSLSDSFRDYVRGTFRVRARHDAIEAYEGSGGLPAPVKLLFLLAMAAIVGLLVWALA